MSKKKIMIVEDELIIAEDIKNTLVRWNYEVPVILTSAEEAVQKCREMSFDLIVMDIAVKGNLDGIEAANQITELYNIPILYLSAYSDKDTLNKAKLNSLFGYMRKPFSNSDLHSVVHWLTARSDIKGSSSNSQKIHSPSVLALRDSAF